MRYLEPFTHPALGPFPPITGCSDIEDARLGLFPGPALPLALLKSGMTWAGIAGVSPNPLQEMVWVVGKGQCAESFRVEGSGFGSGFSVIWGVGIASIIVSSSSARMIAVTVQGTRKPYATYSGPYVIL